MDKTHFHFTQIVIIFRCQTLTCVGSYNFNAIFSKWSLVDTLDVQSSLLLAFLTNIGNKTKLIQINNCLSWMEILTHNKEPFSFKFKVKLPSIWKFSNIMEKYMIIKLKGIMIWNLIHWELHKIVVYSKLWDLIYIYIYIYI